MSFAEQMAAAISGAPLRMLDDLSRDIWKALNAGLLNDDDAQRLAEAIHEKRTVGRGERALGQAPKAGSGVSRPWSYFPPKRRQRSPDKQRSMERRRTLAASGPLPPQLAAHFTTGELAVLRVVSDEVGARGSCVLSIPEIAARAGVSVSTAKRAFKQASKLCLVTIEERRVPYRPNLSNVVRIISREWLAWIDRRGRCSTPRSALFDRSTKREGFKNGGPRIEKFSEKGEDTSMTHSVRGVLSP